jgi:transcriptional regulator with XRE-family HTH domain
VSRRDQHDPVKVHTYRRVTTRSEVLTRRSTPGPDRVFHRCTITYWRGSGRWARLSRVDGDNLAEIVGVVLCAERNRANLSQAQFAERVGVSQQRLSRIERGTVSVSLVTVQGIFAKLGKQLRVEVVPLRADMDVDIDRGLALTNEDRAVEFGRHRILLRTLGDIPFAVTGLLAAFAQGAPTVGPPSIDIVIARSNLDELAAAMEKSSCRRWSAKWDDWGFGASDPREPGVPRWLIGRSDTRLQFVDELPQTIEVSVGEHRLRVVPIAEIEREDPWLHRLMSRWRDRSGPIP